MERKSIATAKGARTRPRIHQQELGKDNVLGCVGLTAETSGTFRTCRTSSGGCAAAIKLANECQLLLPLMALMSSSLSVPNHKETKKVAKTRLLIPWKSLV